MKKLERHLLVIRLNAYHSFQIGESISGECSGDGAVARFEGVLTGQAGQDLTIHFTSALCYEPSDTTIRIKAEGVTGSLHDGVSPIDLLVMDVSPMSLGGIVERTVGLGAKMEMSIQNGTDDIQATVKVVNCRVTQEGCYRIGMMIVDIGRLDEARWTRLIERLMAA